MEQKAQRLGAFFLSPLPDSNPRPPPYHPDRGVPGGSHPFALVHVCAGAYCTRSWLSRASFAPVRAAMPATSLPRGGRVARGTEAEGEAPQAGAARLGATAARPRTAAEARRLRRAARHRLLQVRGAGGGVGEDRHLEAAGVPGRSASPASSGEGRSTRTAEATGCPRRAPVARLEGRAVNASSQGEGGGEAGRAARSRPRGFLAAAKRQRPRRVYSSPVGPGAGARGDRLGGLSPRTPRRWLKPALLLEKGSRPAPR
jgi:hypothetical protein